MNEEGFLIKKDFTDDLFKFQRLKERNRIINTFKIPFSMVREIKGKSDRIYGRRLFNQCFINIYKLLDKYDLPSLPNKTQMYR